MTFAQAANRLGCTKRSIHNYIKRGFLRRKVFDGEAMIEREDVEQLAEEMGTDYPALNRKTIYQILSRLKKLEERYEVVAQIWDTLGLQEKPLRPAPPEAAGLFQAASAYLSVSKFQVKELEKWASLFVQFDEQTITAVGEVTNSHQPWKPFHDLAQRMVLFVSQQKETKGNLALQALQAKLELGRRRVREAALFWIEEGRGTVPRAAFKLLDTPKEDLLRALSGKSP